MVFSYISHKGLIKTTNQDSIGHKECNNNRIFVVCDGVGGLPKGDLASKTAVKSILKTFKNNNSHTIQSRLQNCMHSAQESVKKVDSDKIGTTVAACIIEANNVHASWCGDSRIYHLRKNRVMWISKDHNVLHDILNKGKVNKKILKHSQSLNRFFGLNTKNLSEYHSFNTLKRDKILICSDGLTNFISEKKIIDFITNNSPQNASNLLMDQLLSSQIGAPDNFSWYIIEI